MDIKVASPGPAFWDKGLQPVESVIDDLVAARAAAGISRPPSSSAA